MTDIPNYVKEQLEGEYNVRMTVYSGVIRQLIADARAAAIAEAAEWLRGHYVGNNADGSDYEVKDISQAKVTHSAKDTQPLLADAMMKVLGDKP